MNNNANRIESYFKENRVEAEFINHDPAGSAKDYSIALGTRLQQQVKVLLIRYKGIDGKGYATVAIQAHKQVDLENIKSTIGASKIKMADKDSLFTITGCSFGELHPFASIFGLRLLMDKDLLNEQKVYFNAGCLNRSASIRPKVIVDLEQPIMF